MSPIQLSQNGSPDVVPLNLFITGLGVEYPPYLLVPSDLNTLCARHYPESESIKRVLAINNFTGIDSRSAIGSVDHPLVNMSRAPSIREVCESFLEHGIALAVTASRKALHEAQLTPADITHVVSTTCTNSANPGFDHFVCKGLGITQPVEKILLHGVGCSGGLASLRTAANVALGASFQRRKARVLVVCLEISSILCRSELDSVSENQETRIGITLFSDCASALVLSNGIGGENEECVYELCGWEHSVIPDTEGDLGFDVDPLGWKVVLSHRVPKIASSIVSPTFTSLLSHLPSLPETYQQAADFDWALHPGGSSILTGVEKAMSISSEHIRASYDTYIKHGNSSSATIFSVMNRLRHKDMDALAPGGQVKDFVVACAFGPGIAIEMAMLKRNRDHVERVWVPEDVSHGVATPPETESEGSRSEGEVENEAEVKVRHDDPANSSDGQSSKILSSDDSLAEVKVRQDDPANSSDGQSSKIQSADDRLAEVLKGVGLD